MSTKNIILLLLSFLSITTYAQSNNKHQCNIALNYVGVSRYRGIELPIEYSIKNGYSIQLNTAWVYKKPYNLPSDYNSFINGVLVDKVIMVDLLLNKTVDKFSSPTVVTKFAVGLSYVSFNSKKDVNPVPGFVFDGITYKTEIANVVGLKMQPQINFSLGKVVDFNINGIVNINPYKPLVGASTGLRFHIVK